MKQSSVAILVDLGNMSWTCQCFNPLAMSCPWHGDSGCFPTYVGAGDDFDPTDYGEEDEEAKEETKKRRAIVENKTEIKEEAQKTKKARDTTSASHPACHDAAGLWRQPQPDPGVQDIRRCRAKCPECDHGQCMHDHGHEQRGVGHRCDLCNYMDDKVKWGSAKASATTTTTTKKPATAGEKEASSGGDLAGLWRQPHEDASSK